MKAVALLNVDFQLWDTIKDEKVMERRLRLGSGLLDFHSYRLTVVSKLWKQAFIF